LTNTAALSLERQQPSESDIHTPVLLGEVMSGIGLVSGGIYVDGTLGMGGHTAAFFAAQPDIRVVAMDWDAESMALARKRLSMFGDRIFFVNSSFARLKEALSELNIPEVDGILLDLGYSSYQLERSGRGFSFLRDEPLDMRMDMTGDITAADMLNSLPHEAIEKIIHVYGEESWAKKIAKSIVEYRKLKPLTSSLELSQLIFRVIPRKFHPRRLHPATRTFQALRIAVNTELEQLRTALEVLPDCLKNGGRLCIISFHSLEDRLVKDAFRSDRRLAPVTKKPVAPSDEESSQNVRARSAKLRIASRCQSDSSEQD